MTDQNASADAIAAVIESATDGRWGVWLSDTGWWWAARTHALSAHDLAAGGLPFLHADNPDELTERIQQQEHLLSGSPLTRPARTRDHQGPAAWPAGALLRTDAMTSSTSPAAPAAPQRHEQKFEARLDQVREARQFLAGILDGCPAVDEVLLVASELAANSVLHSASSQTGGTFTIAADIYQGDHVRIEAHDDGGPWNQCHHHDGRPHGLDIIAQLATSHGVSGDPLTGWTTWAILPWHPAPVTKQPPPEGDADDHHDR